MSIVQKIAKIDMFFRHRFWVALGWVLGRFWNAKNLDFQSFFEAKSTTKMIDVLEDSKKLSRTRKKHSQGALRPWARDRGDKILGQVAFWGGTGGITNSPGLWPKRVLR